MHGAFLMPRRLYVVRPGNESSYCKANAHGVRVKVSVGSSTSEFPEFYEIKISSLMLH